MRTILSGCAVIAALIIAEADSFFQSLYFPQKYLLRKTETV
jgi:hypothetical protein